MCFSYFGPETYSVAGHRGLNSKESLIRNTPSTAGNSMTGSERPSPEPLLKKEASPAVLGGREFWKRSGSLKCLELYCLGHPSRTLEGNSRKRSESVFRGLSGILPEFLPESPSRTGGAAQLRCCSSSKRQLTLKSW